MASHSDSTEETAPQDKSSDAPSRDWKLQWDSRAPVPMKTVELRIPATPYFFFKDPDMKDIKALRPCGNGVTKQVQKQLKASLDGFYAQPWRWDGEEHVVVTETYKTSCARFPGDLCCGEGSPGMWRPIRSHLLSETADLDMKVAMPTILLWICKQFGIACPQLEWYVNHRDEVLTKLMTDDDCSRTYAKEQFNIPWTWDQKLRGSKSQFLKDYDAEAKRIQPELMAQPELQWVLAFCEPEGSNSKNRAGCFVAKLWHFPLARLMQRVMHLVEHEEGERVSCVVHDGFNIANAALRGDEPLLVRCKAACEQVCPGIDMGWAWKPLDFEVRTKDKKVRVPDRAEGKVLIVGGQLCIPDDYDPPEPEDADASDAVTLDPQYEPTYDELYTEFSLPGGKHGKVGSDFIEVLDEDGVDGRGRKLVVYGRDKFIQTHEDMVFYTIKKTKDGDGNEIAVKQTHSFMKEWIKDPMKDARWLRDPSRKCKWEYFDMYPDASKCPANCYNLWRGFAAESMAPEVDPSDLEPIVQQGLDRILGHISMLCERDGPRHEKFLLDWLAHLLQHPSLKFGVMCCLVGVQGLGKGQLWDAIERMVGSHACFETNDPARDVWGDNNDNMRTAFMVRICESNSKAYAGQIGTVRNMITDPKIRVRSLYGAAVNVRSFFRGFGDSNDRNAYPDTDNERRFFVLNCNPAKLGDAAYMKALGEAIADDRVIRALYLLLKARTGIKERYSKADIPVGEFARELKASKRPVQETFLVWLIEQQPLDATEMRFTDDALYAKFKAWQEEGNEFERSKQSFLSWVRLSSFDIPGITKHRPEVDVPGQPSHVDGKPVEKKKIQVTEYILNLTKLRTHYHLSAAPESRLNLSNSVAADDGASNDEAAAVAGSEAAGSSREHHGSGSEPMDADEDDEDAIEPGQRGNDEAVSAAAAASSGAVVVVSGVSAGEGAHGVAQSEEEIARLHAERKARQQAQKQRPKGKQRAHPVSGGSVAQPPAKRPRPVCPGDALGGSSGSGGSAGASAFNLGDAVQE